jgi:uncharacterized protein (TIGR00251 family)
VGWVENVLAVRIKGVPEKGKVNEELIAFLAKELKIAKSQIEILKGHTSRYKKLVLKGLSKEAFTHVS